LALSLLKKVSASALLTVAVSLLTLGISFLKEGDVFTGVACIIVGFGLIVVTVYLLEKGLIEKLRGMKVERSRQ